MGCWAKLELVSGALLKFFIQILEKWSVNSPFAAKDHVVQNPPCWRASSLLFPYWDIKNKGKSSFTGSGLFVLISQCGNNNGLDSHWVKNWRDSFKPITKLSKCNHVITFDSHLKTALYATTILWPLIPFAILLEVCRLIQLSAILMGATTKSSWTVL